MDKYELLLDVIEHPENYPAEKIKDMLSDPETREIYNLLCKTNSAVNSEIPADVDAEWTEFRRRHHPTLRQRYLGWFGSRAASIAAIAGTAIMAVAAGIAITVSVKETKYTSAIKEPQVNIPSSPVAASSDSIMTDPDTIKRDLTPVMFENESLGVIMSKIAASYSVGIRFDNKYALSLHLYYRLDPSLPLDEVVSQLNTFEQINIKRNGNILTIY